VIIDGQQVDTTPFARSIPVSAGTHYVRFEHPEAQTERRTVQLAPGETVLLDVTMRLTGAPVDAGADASPLGVGALRPDDTSP
jgi:serine/threonine-protein kinase